jgi:hypothetical protein
MQFYDLKYNAQIKDRNNYFFISFYKKLERKYGLCIIMQYTLFLTINA